MIIEQLIKVAKARVECAKDSLAKFAASVIENPDAAMLRSSTLFTETAALVVWTEVLNSAEGGAEPEAIVSTLEEYIYYTAANPPHSSSQLGNYLEVEKNRVRAEAAKHVKRLISVATPRTATTTA